MIHIYQVHWSSMPCYLLVGNDTYRKDRIAVALLLNKFK